MFLFHQFDDIFVHSIVAIFLDVVNGSSRQTNDATNVFVLDAETRAVVKRGKESGECPDPVHDHDIETHGEKERVLLVDVVKVQFGDRQIVSKASIVTNEYKVLLIIWEHLHVFLLVFAVRPEDSVPQRHEQSVIGTEIGVVTEMYFWCVQQVRQRRPLARE